MTVGGAVLLLKIMAKKKITIEDLARMIKRGFDEAARSDEVNERQKWASKRLEFIDVELKAIRKQLTGVVYRHEFEGLESHV